jgi:cobaltochelatase CobS
MENEIVRQVIKTIREDILKDKVFLSEILSKVKLRKDNIPKDLILLMMNTLGTSKPVPRPVSNAPKDISEGNDAVAKPVPMGANTLTAKIVSDLLEGNNVYLMGKAGTGKTYTAKGIAESIMGQPTYVINCSQWTSPIEIRGGQTIKGYEEGQLIKAWATGGVLILDELPKLDPNTAGLLNDALAETSSQPKYNKQNQVIESTIPYIVNGRGDKIYKGQDQKNPDLKYKFCVIGTGNTDMMNVGNKYAGNQRQDYSLVDRFAGSFYTLEQDPTKEMELTYTKVFEVCNAMRDFLIEKDAIQSISLRTMLNFNRTFEQQMLFKMESPYADQLFDENGITIPPKTIDDSIESFKDMLDKKMRDELELNVGFREAVAMRYDEDDFTLEFKIKYHHDPRTGDALTQQEIASLLK